MFCLSFVAVSDRQVATPAIEDGALEMKAEVEEATTTSRSKVDRVMVN